MTTATHAEDTIRSRDGALLTVGSKVWIRRPGTPGPHSLGRYKVSRMRVVSLGSEGRVTLRSVYGGRRVESRPAKLVWDYMDNAAGA